MSTKSHSILINLGQRIKLRRKELGQSCTIIETTINMKPGLLRQWEARLPIKSKQNMENALEDALSVPRGWIRDPLIKCNDCDISTTTIDLSTYGCKTVSDEIRCIGSWLSRSIFYKRTCNFEDLQESEVRRANIFAERYGVNGASTLQSIGDKHGLTRERIRQIVDKMVQRLNEVKFSAPNILKLKELIDGSVPTTLEIFNDKFKDILGESLSLENADGFSREVMGIAIASFSEKALANTDNAIMRIAMSVQKVNDGLNNEVRNASRRMIRSCGAAQIMYVTGMVSEALNKPVSLAEIEICLQSIEGMEWIVKDDGWFWFGVSTANNRAVEITRKVMSILNTRRIDIEDIQQAICRSRQSRVNLKKESNYRPPMIELPRYVLCDVLARVPFLSVVQYDDFILKENIEPNEVLSDAEYILYNLLKKHGGVASRNTLFKEVVDTNMISSINFQILLASSPIIRPIGGTLFMLRGWICTNEAMQQAFKSRPNSLGYARLEADSEGWVEFDLRMTTARFRDLIMDLPAAAMDLPPGQYSFEGVATGKFDLGITRKGNSPRRFSTLFVKHLQRIGVKDSDVLTVRIHPEMMRGIILIKDSLI